MKKNEMGGALSMYGEEERHMWGFDVSERDHW
jgi:hypothetical protein